MLMVGFFQLGSFGSPQGNVDTCYFLATRMSQASITDKTRVFNRVSKVHVLSRLKTSGFIAAVVHVATVIAAAAIKITCPIMLAAINT